MAAKDDGYVRWHCKHCGQRLKIRKTYEGGNVIRCPSCKRLVNVPLANIDAIAETTEMEETGMPGQLQLDRDKLLRRLSGKGEKADGPGSPGATPSLRSEKWDAEAAFGRIEELDLLASAINRIEQETMGEIQRAYRDKALGARERAQMVQEAGEHRIEELEQLVKARLATVRRKMQPLRSKDRNLNPSERRELRKLQRAEEAIGFYGKHVLGVEP
ncbi:MAG: hypothetical protein R6V05_02975 [Candidatus Brocadiia bacterium]